METIAAISTPRGYGGIGIVRISGDDAINIANAIFVPYKKNKDSNGILEMKGYTAKLGKVVFNNEVLDEAIALVFKKPCSYTGEDMEIAFSSRFFQEMLGNFDSEEVK